MKARERILMATLAILILFWSYTHGAPQNRDSMEHSRDFDRRLAEWLMSEFDAYRRDRKVPIDAGLLSRHSMVKNYMKGLKAKSQVLDPYGPGRRK